MNVDVNENLFISETPNSLWKSHLMKICIDTRERYMFF